MTEIFVINQNVEEKVKKTSKRVLEVIDSGIEAVRMVAKFNDEPLSKSLTSLTILPF